MKAHQNELEKISAVLVHDTGTGRVLTLGLHDNYQDRELVDQVLAPLHELKLLEPSMARSYGTDHLSFDNAGVPGFFCIQDFAEYRLTHHSQSDTFDKVWKDDLNQGAQVLAAWAYNTAQLPVMLPRRPLPYNPGPSAKESQPDTAKPADPIADLDTKIIDQVKADEPELKANLTYLADRIGPRLTGSPKQIQASHWTEEQFKAAGLSNVHLEPWTIEKGWTRGTASGHIVSPVEQQLTFAAYGWSPSTNGAVRGPVDCGDGRERFRSGEVQGQAERSDRAALARRANSFRRRIRCSRRTIACRFRWRYRRRWPNVRNLDERAESRARDAQFLRHGRRGRGARRHRTSGMAC